MRDGGRESSRDSPVWGDVGVSAANRRFGDAATKTSIVAAWRSSVLLSLYPGRLSSSAALQRATRDPRPAPDTIAAPPTRRYYDVAMAVCPARPLARFLARRLPRLSADFPRPRFSSPQPALLRRGPCPRPTPATPTHSPRPRALRLGPLRPGRPPVHLIRATRPTDSPRQICARPSTKGHDTVACRRRRRAPYAQASISRA